MTQDDVIRMAREALKQEPREDWNSTAWVFADETLEAFAKLIAQEVRDRIMFGSRDDWVLAEREACAKVCDELSNKHTWEGSYADECAEAIRARGGKA